MFPLAKYALALAAGALLATSFAPLQWWPLAVLAPAVLIGLWDGAAPRQAAALGFWFNVGTFSAGTYWLYISIHGFGEAPIWIAFLLMGGLIGIMAVYGALLGYLIARCLPRAGALRAIAGIPAAWTLIEWLRGWLFSGFAWLSLGYSQTDTVLGRAFAPVLGVYGLTALLLVAAGALVTLVRGSARERSIAGLALIVPWLAAVPLAHIAWTHPVGKPVGVAIVQGDIPQDQKWLDSNRDTTLARYRDLTMSALGTPIIVWPEAAAPDLANNLTTYLLGIYRAARGHGSAVVLGIVRAEGLANGDDAYFNSVLSLGTSIGWYDKRHLVPFAEFFPVPGFVRSWLRLMSLPYSDFTRGGPHQPPLEAGGLALATTVCYEDAYDSYELGELGESDALVNVTNDAWFGHSSARYQHFQIARMRAMETGRYLLRAANDGISGVIGPRGSVVAQAPQYRPVVLKATIRAYRGLPPFALFGNWLIISVAATTLGVAIAGGRALRLAVRAHGAPAAATREHRAAEDVS
ncbi:MAG TPA: apolipoprotein N-acyltransferase [Steroidobacteraceae bacterium]|nr:apolipoprotein N-acyltransferase [Steroidobacteraceae bacterium]